MISPKEQANLKAGAYLKCKGQLVQVEYAGIDINGEPYVVFYLDDGPYRSQKNSVDLSKPTTEEIKAYKQKQLDQS